MAQLRDRQTGECIAEGTATEMALLALELDTETMFDGVGLAFDPAAALAAHQEEVDGARKLEKSDATDQYLERLAKIAPDAASVKDATERVKAARKLAQ